MAVKVITWSREKAQLEIKKRFQFAQDSRVYLEDRWVRNEKSVYSSSGLSSAGFLNPSLENNYQTAMPGIDSSLADMNVSYAFKNFRFIHAQMSANPPSVVMRPTSSDQDDHRKADAADRVVRYAIRKYNMQEMIDQQSLHTLLYGTGVMKVVWDSTKGDIIDWDEETGEMKLEGDIDVTVPFTWNIFIDPDAKTISDVKWVMERIYMDYDEALSHFGPEYEDVLKKCLVTRGMGSIGDRTRSSQMQNDRYNSVELLEYWEVGLPTNGYLGRYCMATVQGELLQEPRPNPYRFKQAGAVSKIEADESLTDEEKKLKIKRLPEKAQLPYHILTDIDVPNMVWGRSFVEYIAHLQEYLNRLDSAKLDNIQAHGVARMVLPDGTDVSEDSLSNSPWDIVRITGNQPPYFMSPPTLMPDMSNTRQDLVTGINDVSGVNESMFGQQSREQSGASMQYATNQGNMIRRRLFNKYVLDVESIYKGILNLVRKHWTIDRTIYVLGKENALEAIELKGADIDGGYDVVGEYGVSLSLDPQTRREEIMMLQPLFEKAGMPIRQILGMMKLNELDEMYDDLQLAENRQKEIFDIMIATGTYIAPEELMDHTNMIAFALKYFMTREFDALAPELKLLCKQHIKDRVALAAQEQAQMSGAAPAAAPGPVPSGAESLEQPTPIPTEQPPIVNG